MEKREKKHTKGELKLDNDGIESERAKWSLCRVESLLLEWLLTEEFYKKGTKLDLHVNIKTKKYSSGSHVIKSSIEL